MGRLPVIDFHTHVLPRMDDGSKSSEMSLEMLRQMKSSGVDLVVATSHYYHRNESIDRFLARREASYRHLREKTDRTYPLVVPGAEVAFYFGIEEEPEIGKLCIGDTDVLLLEMPFAPWSTYELNAVSSLCYDRRLTVVLAHYERFVEFQEENRMLERILELPVLVQINAEDLLPAFAGRRWVKMFEEGKAHLLGSDAHNLTNRAPNLAEGRAVLQKKLGDEALRKIDRCGAKLLMRSAASNTAGRTDK